MILEFPDNRENNREFRKFLANSAIAEVHSCSNSCALRANSLLAGNRESFSPEQGIHPPEQGITRADARYPPCFRHFRGRHGPGVRVGNGRSLLIGHRIDAPSPSGRTAVVSCHPATVAPGVPPFFSLATIDFSSLMTDRTGPTVEAENIIGTILS